MFGFQRLDAYRAATEFLGVTCKRRFYTIARGSALECAAIPDALEAMTVFDEASLREARDLLERIVSMLTGLIRP